MEISIFDTIYTVVCIIAVILVVACSFITTHKENDGDYNEYNDSLL